MKKTSKKLIIESHSYPAFYHAFVMHIIPIYHMATWKVCEHFKYSNQSALFGLGLPALHFVATPLFDHTLAALNVYVKEADPKAPSTRVVGESHMRPGKTQSKKLMRQNMEMDAMRYTRVLRSYAIFHAAMFLYSMYKVQELGDAPWRSAVFWTQFVVLGVIQGSGGGAIAHELFHRFTSLDRFWAQVLLSQILYNHFSVEHVLGHHRNVGTDKDPATAKFNQSYYSFLLQSSIGGYLQSWQLEKERILAAHNTKTLSTWTLVKEHRILHYAIISFVIVPSLVYVLRGWTGMFAFFVQVVLGVCIVEGINYFEHYGLRRHKRMDGTYEPVEDWHSWDRSYGHMSKLSFINIILHSDHHHHPTKHYQNLQVSTHEKTPHLPFPYSIMLLISFVPPLFFHIMNKHPTFSQQINSTS